jgi:hypothetical protein
VHEDVVLDYTFAGEDDVFGAEDGGAAGDFVAGFLVVVVRLEGLEGKGWVLTVSIYSPREVGLGAIFGIGLGPNMEY